MRRDAEIGGAFDDLLGHGEADLGILGNPGVVVGDRHHRHVVFLDQRQHKLETVLFAGDRVQQRTAFAGLQTGLERGGHRAVDAERHVDEALHQLDDLGHQWRFGLVRVGVRVIDHARVDIEHRGPGLDLGDGIGFDGRKIAGLKFGCELFAPGGVDAFTNHAERLIKADDGGFGFALDDSAGHVTSFRRG